MLYCFPELDSIKETDASENSGILQIICESEIQKDDGELVCPIRILSQLFVVPNEFPRICKLVAPDVGESDEAAAMIGVKYDRVVLAFNGRLWNKEINIDIISCIPDEHLNSIDESEVHFVLTEELNPNLMDCDV